MLQPNPHHHQPNTFPSLRFKKTASFHLCLPGVPRASTHPTAQNEWSQKTCSHEKFPTFWVASSGRLWTPKVAYLAICYNMSTYIYIYIYIVYIQIHIYIYQICIKCINIYIYVYIEITPSKNPYFTGWDFIPSPNGSPRSGWNL